MKQGFLVVYEFASGTYSGYAPDLPGCISAGGTHKEIRKKMREAVGNHVGLMVARGNEIPNSKAHNIQCPKPAQESDVQHWIVERVEIEVPVSGQAESALASA
ncbi:MAG TPA: type II toxin-antitoxin system HicB family antitoxin [Terracidiphilus sp.]|jgi:predicted RNase H-like HicB family nuclease|nr:type II toxin-antitoxin system HicB family antitoxin [Terracidiphilus sp.]